MISRSLLVSSFFFFRFRNLYYIGNRDSLTNLYNYVDSWSPLFPLIMQFGHHGQYVFEEGCTRSLPQVLFLFCFRGLISSARRSFMRKDAQSLGSISSNNKFLPVAKNNSVSRSFKRFPCQRHRFNAVQVSMDCQPVIIGPHVIVLEALNKDVMGQSHSSLSGYIINHSKRVRLLFSSFIYKLRHSSLVNVGTVPRCGFSTSTTVNKHVLTWLGGGGGWRSKRFPVIVAQRGWYSASTSWHYA